MRISLNFAVRLDLQQKAKCIHIYMYVCVCVCVRMCVRAFARVSQDSVMEMGNFSDG